MKNSGTARPIHVTLILLFGLFILGTAEAQDNKSKKVEITQDGETVTIQVEDGQTRVNGELIPEGADIEDYLPEGFDAQVFVGDDGDVHMFGSAGEDNVFFGRRAPRGSGNTFRFSDDDDEHAPVRFRFEGGEEMAARARELQARRFELAGGPEFEVIREMGPNGFFFSSSPEISKKEREAREIASKLRSTEGSDRGELEAELDSLLDEIFEAKMEIREQRVQNLRKEIEENEKALSERRTRKSEIIERRKAELTGSDYQYRW
ncbi:MAG: hypothetical protein HKN43_11415 [Rhodothermales bacterium]|nr:hypothetical protein [Rhodothermales bacterium]